MTRSTRRVAVIVVALMVALSGAFVLQGAVAQESGNDSGDEADEDGSLDVVSLTAPESAAPGSTVQVAAEIENPTDSRLTENVEYRVDGQVVDTELVTVQPGESVVIQFTADTEGLEAGQIYHGVFTEEAGQVQEITLSESFTLDSVDAPESASVGDELTVEADVSNPNDFETEQVVKFRLGGQVLDEERLTLDGGESDTVTFSAETDDLEAGDYVHGIFTRDDGQFLQLNLTAAAVEEPEETETEAPLNETETEEPVENVTETETEVPLDETETAVPINETETEEPVNETETAVPINETETEEPIEENVTEEPLNETETEAPLNETETETETETPTEVEEEPSASVVFPTYNSTMVTVNQVTLSDGGFVAIHNQTEDGEVGPVIGVSEYLEPGDHENVEVHLFNVSGAEYDQTELTESQTLIAMPHLDTNDNETYDFVATDGAEDGPYTENGSAVTDEAYIHIETTDEPVEEPETETETETEAPLNETETEAPLNETETEAPLNETETEAPLNETETEEPVENVTEEPVEENVTEEPVEENVTEVPLNETETEAPLNETETEAPLNETDEDADVTLNDTDETDDAMNATDNATAGVNETEAAANASVSFMDQTSNGTAVTVDNVTVPDGGYVAIHDQFLYEGDVIGSVVGVSEYLEPGEHENVTVHLFNVSGAEFVQDELTENQTLIAMPHQETNDNQTYDFVATNGTEDDAYTENGSAVTDAGMVVVEEDVEPAEENDTVGLNETDNESDAGLEETDNETVGLNESDNETVDLNETENESDAGLNETDDEDADVTLNETDGTDDAMNVTDNATAGVNETDNESDAGLEETDNETVGLNESDNETVGLNETENETDAGLNETENETDAGLNETDNETADAEMDENVSVEITNVSTQGTEVTVNATLQDGGYVAVHNESLLANATAIDEDELVTSTVGVSEYLEPGDHENVTITLFNVSGAEFETDALEESQIILAMPHQETNDNESFDYVLTNGSEDGPYTIDDRPIVSPAIFDAPDDETLVGFNETADNETADLNETENETDAGLNETENETDAGLNETGNETVGLNETENETDAGLNDTAGLNETDDEDAGVSLNETNETDDGLNETDNETVGLNETDNETDAGLNETEETVTVTAQTEVNFENQTANETENGTAVTIESVTLSEGGFVAIHNESLLDGDAVGSVVGVSEYLQSGTYENLSVVLYNVTGAEFDDTELTENETLIAMPHMDTNGNETYDFVATNGTEDGAYTEDGEAVVENATVAPVTEDATLDESANESANDSAALAAP